MTGNQRSLPHEIKDGRLTGKKTNIETEQHEKSGLRDSVCRQHNLMYHRRRPYDRHSTYTRASAASNLDNSIIRISTLRLHVAMHGNAWRIEG